MRRSLAGGLLPRRMWRWSGLWLVVCVGITTAQRPLSAAEIRAIETQPPPPPSPPEPPAPPPTPRVRAEGELKLLLVQALFRHGDRTPYSPLRDKHFWETTLPDAEDIAEISSLTIPLRSSSEPNCHPAAGNGPFGSLTIKGIAQMEARGELLRDALVHSKGEARPILGGKEMLAGNSFLPESYDPGSIVVWSTDFPRTIQSVQALLYGLYPPETRQGHTIPIDTRNTDDMHPDPHPRQKQKTRRSLTPHFFVLVTHTAVFRDLKYG